MGIVLKRHGNAPVVKDIYGGIIDIIMFLTTNDYSHEIQNELNEIKTNIIKNKSNLLFVFGSGSGVPPARLPRTWQMLLLLLIYVCVYIYIEREIERERYR